MAGVGAWPPEANERGGGSETLPSRFIITAGSIRVGERFPVSPSPRDHLEIEDGCHQDRDKIDKIQSRFEDR